MDFSKIEINRKLLGVLNFNLMVPIEEEQLQLVEEWCQTNSEVICNKENVL